MIPRDIQSIGTYFVQPAVVKANYTSFTKKKLLEESMKVTRPIFDKQKAYKRNKEKEGRETE